jgi:hypothetical protein
MKFTMTTNGNTFEVENYGLYLKDHVYSFSFFKVENAQSNFDTEKEKIITSIKFAKGLTPEDQLNSHVENTFAYKLGEIVGVFFFFAVIVLIIFFIIKKSKRAF